MNAPHPIRALHGHLVGVAPSLDDMTPAEPLPSATEAMVRLETSLAILDGIAESALTAVRHLDRASLAGAGSRFDYLRLEDVAAKFAAVERLSEAARARLSDKLAGAR